MQVHMQKWMENPWPQYMVPHHPLCCYDLKGEKLNKPAACRVASQRNGLPLGEGSSRQVLCMFGMEVLILLLRLKVCEFSSGEIVLFLEESCMTRTRADSEKGYLSKRVSSLFYCFPVTYWRKLFCGPMRCLPTSVWSLQLLQVEDIFLKHFPEATCIFLLQQSSPARPWLSAVTPPWERINFISPNNIKSHLNHHRPHRPTSTC